MPLSATMDDDRPTGPSLLAYLQLLRLPNVFTVVSDVLMGYLLVHQSLQPWPSFAGLLAASCCLYLAGMVLNDVFDLEVDRRERPQRPLPSGRVPFKVARVLGWGLLMIGWLLTILVTFLPEAQQRATAAPAVVGTLLALAIVAYDAWLKSTIAGPLLMGLCRFLNVLLAMSLVRHEAEDLLPWGPAQLIAAAAIGLHIAGVTWFARDEASLSRRGTLLIGAAIMIAGWTMLGWLPTWLPAASLRLPSGRLWYFLPVLAGPLILRALRALVAPTPVNVQHAVRVGIWSLIWMDAMIVLLVTTQIWALIVAFMFVPMYFLGRWVYAT